MDRKLVLIAHGQESTLARARVLLSTAPYRVITASTGLEACGQMTANSPDLVVVDAEIEGVDQILMARAFHGAQSRGTPALVLLRGGGTVDQLTREFEAGALCHIFREEAVECLPDIVETAFERLEIEQEFN